MIRALMVVIPILLTHGVASWVGFRIGLRRQPAQPVDQKLLAEYARLLRMAGDAQLRGEIGLAEMYSTAAHALTELENPS